MTFWFCYNCKKIWHSHIQTPENVNRIRCFYCLKNTSVRVKEDRLVDKKFRYVNYDKNTREFLDLHRERLEKENSESKKKKPK